MEPWSVPKHRDSEAWSADVSATRPPAVAGVFYPADAQELRRAVTGYLDAAAPSGPAPKAIVAPHAGYAYSGSVAASSYARVAPAQDLIERVVILGPAHRALVRGVAVPSVASFETPLGSVPVDREALRSLLGLPIVGVSDAAHAQEHSIEVHLPLLQQVLERFRIVPLLVGDANVDEVADALDIVWGADETLVVVSSDLSHHHDYDTAVRLDSATADAIVSLRDDLLGRGSACGRTPISALLRVARRRELSCELLDLRNSGDTAGSRDGVVGYGAFAIGDARSR